MFLFFEIIAGPAAGQSGRNQPSGRPVADLPLPGGPQAPALPAEAPLAGVVEAPPRVPVPAVERLAAIRGRGELAVCIWPEYFAISYRNPRNSELEGIDIDMARALANRLAVTLRFVETNFAEFIDRVESGACDVAMMGVGILPSRQERLAFTKPYLASAVYAVTTRESSRIGSWQDIDSGGTVVAVAAGTLMEPLMRQTLKQAELLVVRPPRTREAEVQSGRADVFMSDFPYTRRMVLMHDWARVIDPPGRFGDTLYGYAVARGETAWLTEVNAFVTAAKADGTLARAAARHGLTQIVVY